MLTPLRPVTSVVLRVLMSNFVPFRVNGQICCSDEDALCDVCKSKNAVRTHRSASTPLRLLAECPPPDAYAIDAQKLRAANERAEGVIDLPSIRKSSEFHLDANGIPCPYFADVERLRAEYAR